MNSDLQPKRLPDADSRYDVHRTLQTYQPEPQVVEQAMPVGGFGKTDELAEEKPGKRLGWKRIMLLLLVALISPVLIIGVWDYKNASSASQKMFGNSNVLSALLPASIEKTDNRTNLLLIGYSADDPGHAGAQLTDSIMIISMDKSKKSGYSLSIPRDLYVRIPNYGSAKINEAYQAGEQQSFSEPGYSAGGKGLLQKVIKENFDIDVHYTVVINYSAVRDITTALDGITVNIESTDPRGIYDPNFKPEEGGPLMLANGQHLIDGQTALRLTRARGSTFGSYGFPRSDFDRTINQQKVFAAIKSEINLWLLLDPRQNKDFFDAVADNIQTDIGIREVLPIYSLMNSIPENNMKQINLSDVDKVNYLASYRTPSGQSALIPAAGINNYSDIQSLIKSL